LSSFHPARRRRGGKLLRKPPKPTLEGAREGGREGGREDEEEEEEEDEEGAMDLEKASVEARDDGDKEADGSEEVKLGRDCNKEA